MRTTTNEQGPDRDHEKHSDVDVTTRYGWRDCRVLVFATGLAYGTLFGTLLIVWYACGYWMLMLGGMWLVRISGTMSRRTFLLPGVYVGSQPVIRPGSPVDFRHDHPAGRLFLDFVIL